VGVVRGKFALARPAKIQYESISGIGRDPVKNYYPVVGRKNYVQTEN